MRAGGGTLGGRGRGRAQRRGKGRGQGCGKQTLVTGERWGPQTVRMDLRAPGEPSSALAHAPRPGPQARLTHMRTRAHMCTHMLTHARVQTCSHRGVHTCVCTHKAHACMRMHTCACAHGHMHSNARTRRGSSMRRAVPMTGGWRGASGPLPGGGGIRRPAPPAPQPPHLGAPCGPGGGRV